MDPIMTVSDAGMIEMTSPQPPVVQTFALDLLLQSKQNDQDRLVQIPADKQASMDSFDAEVVTVTDRIAATQAKIDQAISLGAKTQAEIDAGNTEGQ